MIDELNRALEGYHIKWHELVGARKDKLFFEVLKPTAVGWKVADQAEYARLMAELHESCDKIIETWMNDRWIAKLHLRDAQLTGGIEIIKIMQRRPGSNDALGLDHVDFYCPDMSKVEQILQAEPQLKWSREDNSAIAGYAWISLWFAGTEAKLKAGTVLDIVTAELKDLHRKIIGTA